MMLYKLFIGVVSLGIMLHAHGTQIHKNETKKQLIQKIDTVINEPIPVDVEKEAMTKIRQSYLQTVKPIFETKCFDCHSAFTTYPWYYHLPGIKTLLDNDIKEARSHIDMSKDFPFLSHETPLNDLNSIQESVLKGHMPPLRYRLMHWDATLSADELKRIVDWTKQGKKILETIR